RVGRSNRSGRAITFPTFRALSVRSSRILLNANFKNGEMSKRVIYDFGANNGDDVAYYLLKAEKVVAVEANPSLANRIRERFSGPLADGRLFVENCVLSAEPTASAVPFHVHKHNHVLSQFPPPPQNQLPQFERVLLASRNVTELIRAHGDPHYIKIDLEHYDQVILRELFASGIFPPYISAESHSIDVFALMVALGNYGSFKLVDGKNIPIKYSNVKIDSTSGVSDYSFPAHSAGPFGEDIAGPWMTKDNFFRLLSFAGLGWKDIHASRVDDPDPGYAPRPQFSVQLKIDF
ncbi:MAG: methyltransferase, partial [Caulobacteraceae bacterium]|nr:methyltransferase [Caulobacteraceae bacterium]